MDIKKMLEDEENNQKLIEKEKKRRDEDYSNNLEKLKKQMQSGLEDIFENIKLKVNNIKNQLQEYPIEIITPSKTHDDTHISWYLIILDKRKENKTLKLKLEFYVINSVFPKYYMTIHQYNEDSYSEWLHAISNDISHLDKKEFDDFDKLFLDFIDSSKEKLVKLKNLNNRS